MVFLFVCFFCLSITSFWDLFIFFFNRTFDRIGNHFGEPAKISKMCPPWSWWSRKWDIWMGRQRAGQSSAVWGMATDWQCQFLQVSCGYVCNSFICCSRQNPLMLYLISYTPWLLAILLFFFCFIPLLIYLFSLFSPSVLDRLNALLEPGGVLTINERGATDGSIPTIKPHPHFRWMDLNSYSVCVCVRIQCVCFRKQVCHLWLHGYQISSNEDTQNCADFKGENISGGDSFRTAIKIQFLYCLSKEGKLITTTFFFLMENIVY